MQGRRLLWLVAAGFFAVTMIGSNLVELAVDYVWMDSMGYGSVFSTILGAKALLGLVGFVVAGLFVWLNLDIALRHVGDPAAFLPEELAVTPLGQILNTRLLRRVAVGVGGVAGVVAGMALSAGWENPLLFLNGVSFGQADPIFGRDPAFYIFTMPFLDQVQSLLWTVTFLTLLGVGAIHLMRMQGERATHGDVISITKLLGQGRVHLAGLGAWMLVLLAAGLYLSRFEEMHRAAGLFTGPGYADIYGTLPVLALKIVSALVAAAVLIFALPRQNFRLLMGVAIAFAVVWIGGNVYSSLLQRFVVSPNELEKERPYLEQHIKATNRAFGLDQVIERPLDEDTELTAADISANRPTINNVRLWDHEPLLDTFSQIQEIRTYYEFVSVDNDRYRINGELRQTMLSPRELSPQSLPSRTWVNERLTFTHGYGVTAGPVNRVNEQGLPVLFVQDLPPRTEVPELEIKHPEIYFGELPDSYVFVNTLQKEFNFPQGDANIFSFYEGKGGIVLNSLWRRLLFAVYLRDMKLLLSEDFTPETRLMIHRNVMQRANQVAPFLVFDPDPYMVIHEGRLVWVLDAYTFSTRYPYAQQVGRTGNYMRNPVKAVVDAKDGTLTFYLIDPTEPIAASYAAMFPGLLRPLSEMPQGIREHLRHPSSFFSIQSSMYATYHMLDVNTFYNKEDQWAIPVVGQQRMEPYYTVMKLPGESAEEFILMLPFTPQSKDNLAAWMVARSDGENYGKLIVYTFPKQKLIFGPKQMVARINQNPRVSQQVTLWDQSGSSVIRGTLLVIPIENSLIYIQPLYLRAEDGRIPELKRVIVGYQNEIAMGLDLEDALAQIFGADTRPAGSSAAASALRAGQESAAAAATEQTLPQTGGTLQSRALRQYTALQEASRKGDWARFGQELQDLGATLQELTREQR